MIGNLLDVPMATRTAARLVAGDFGRARTGDRPGVVARGNAAVKDFLAYLEMLVERRRAKPGNPARDVLTRLIQGEDNGERLTAKEACAQLHLPAQRRPRDHHQPDRQRPGGAARDHPAQKQRLIDDPELIKPAIDEMLRFDSPVQLGNRLTTEAVEIGGIRFDRARHNMCIGAANRDPASSPPEILDVAAAEPASRLRLRPASMRRDGAGAARGPIAISRFLARFPGYALSAPPVRGLRRDLRSPSSGDDSEL